jgi:hypothetical protein
MLNLKLFFIQVDLSSFQIMASLAHEHFLLKAKTALEEQRIADPSVQISAVNLVFKAIQLKNEHLKANPTSRMCSEIRSVSWHNSVVFKSVDALKVELGLTVVG